MKLEQKATINASRETVWSVLADIPRAAQLIPGVKDVAPLGEGRYRGTMQIRIGPMGLNLNGELTAKQDQASYRWRLEGEARDRRVGGGLRVIVDATLEEPSAGISEMLVSTDIQFLGGLGTLGQPLIRARADSQMREFAANLAKEVAKGQ